MIGNASVENPVPLDRGIGIAIRLLYAWIQLEEAPALVLKSEIMGWQWAITFDNPRPADSSTMIAALSALGKLTRVETKTTWILAPKTKVSWRQIRNAIVTNLHPTKGNVLYVNLRTGRAFQRGRSTGFRWRKVV